MDTIGDFLSQINNAYAVGKEQLTTPYSKLKESLAKLLAKKGYLGKIEVEKIDKVKKNLLVNLVYKDGLPMITKAKRMSKPGRRLYVNSSSIPWTAGGAGITIISTSTGLLTGKEARKKKIGGEIICQIW